MAAREPSRPQEARSGAVPTLTALPFTELRDIRPRRHTGALSRARYIRLALERVADAALDQPHPTPALQAALADLTELRAAALLTPSPRGVRR